ncbi:MAG: bifunctional folylpolyglutamate synthase/dihydrofolate synthase [Chitinophagaceae bacterium]
MNYSETLAFLYTQLPMFSRIGGAAYKASLDNIIKLCNKLGNPQNKFKSVHVAGTNGKGSTSHMLAAILQTAGYKTGLYTSPHLFDFRERIKVNGNVCEEAFVVNFVEKIQPVIKEIQPSFFEITVAMAFQYFAEQEVAIAIIEVGMGGRLDSTNIIQPEISIITNISYDHMQFLGDTLPKIAQEKAGIIKEKTPVVISYKQPEVATVFTSIATEKQAPIHFAEAIFKVIGSSFIGNQQAITVKDVEKNIEQAWVLDLAGNYQQYNLPGVLTAIQLLNKKGFSISHEQLTEGLKQVKKLTGFYGRWELLQEKPTVIADVAHNEAGINQLINQLAKTNYNRLHWIIGMVKDKDVNKVLQLLPKQATYYFTQAQIERALPANELKAVAAINGLEGTDFSHVNDALKMALSNAQTNDLILVSGSFFIVAEIDRSILN